MTEFRQYDADLGRWLSPDPLMDEFADWTPYNFNWNNPVNFTDPYGLVGTPSNSPFPENPKNGASHNTYTTYGDGFITTSWTYDSQTGTWKGRDVSYSETGPIKNGKTHEYKPDNSTNSTAKTPESQNADKPVFGFHGMKLEANSGDDDEDYTTEFRQYDADLGRWLTPDPLMAKYPSESPYSFCFNNPVYYVDPLGLEGNGVISTIWKEVQKIGAWFKTTFTKLSFKMAGKSKINSDGVYETPEFIVQASIWTKWSRKAQKGFDIVKREFNNAIKTISTIGTNIQNLKYGKILIDAIDKWGKNQEGNTPTKQNYGEHLTGGNGQSFPIDKAKEKVPINDISDLMLYLNYSKLGLSKNNLDVENTIENSQDFADTGADLIQDIDGYSNGIHDNVYDKKPRGDARKPHSIKYKNFKWEGDSTKDETYFRLKVIRKDTSIEFINKSGTTYDWIE